MDRETVYLDNDEEITSVVDKLKKTDYSAVDLVVPKEALILQSVVNLKLLKRQAETLGKEITLVTQDKVGKKLAEQIGIPVVGKPGETPKEVHMSEEDQEVVAAAAGAAAGAAVAAQAAKKIKADDEDMGDSIEFKEEESPIEKTAEVVGEKPKEPSPVKNEATKSDSKKQKAKKMKRIAIVAGFAALATFVLAYIYLPMVKINIKLAAEKKDVEFTFTADKSYDEVDTEKQIIPAQEITAELEKSYKYPATGKKKTGTKATGTVTLFNNFSTTPKTVDAGSKLVASNGLVFTLNSNATVPGYTDPGGGKVAGKLEGVGVTASAVGPEYNMAKDSVFAVPAVGASTFYGVASAAFTGGTSKDIQYVTQTDVNSAKEDATKQIEQDLVNEVTKKAESNQRIVENAYETEVISAEPKPGVDGEAAEFELKVKAKITALAFTEEDITKLAEDVLGNEIGSGKEIVEKESITAAAEFIEGDFDKGTMKVKVSGEVYIATKIEEDKVKTEISHEKNDAALEYLNAIDGVEEATIVNQFPGFYKRMPRIESNIHFTKEIIK